MTCGKCKKEGSHYIPPSQGEPGFYTCQTGGQFPPGKKKVTPKIGKYVVGTWVSVTVEGRTAVGYIRASHVRFWHTDELRSFRYDVRFEKSFWGNHVMQVDESTITPRERT